MTDPVDPRLLQAARGCRKQPASYVPMVRHGVAGVNYRIDDVARLFSRHPLQDDWKPRLGDMPCVLAPQPWNEYDPNAVAVLVEDCHIGYLWREDAADYAPKLLPRASQGVLLEGWADVWGYYRGDNLDRVGASMFIPDFRYL